MDDISFWRNMLDLVWFFDYGLWREAAVSLLLITTLIIHQINTLLDWRSEKPRGRKTDHFAHLCNKLLAEQDIDRASTVHVVQKGINCITSVAHTWLHLKIVNCTQCNSNSLYHCALQCIICINMKTLNLLIIRYSIKTYPSSCNALSGKNKNFKVVNGPI